jgi:hypothetical protein
MNKIYEGERSSELYLPPGYRVGCYEIKTIKLEDIQDTLWGHSQPFRLKDTPHYQYTLGNPKPLEDYFSSCKGYTWARKGTPHENMTVKDLCKMFDDILNSDKAYLEPPYENHYIIVKNGSSVDGTRRACALLSAGIIEAPVAWVK